VAGDVPRRFPKCATMSQPDFHCRWENIIDRSYGRKPQLLPTNTTLTVNLWLSYRFEKEYVNAACVGVCPVPECSGGSINSQRLACSFPFTNPTKLRKGET
jgi:hypothetical protein